MTTHKPTTSQRVLRLWMTGIAAAAICMLCVIGFLAWLGLRWMDSGDRQTKAAGDAIAAAVLQYHQQHAEFPPTLDALVPRYINTIPPPGTGAGYWLYGETTDTVGGATREITPARNRNERHNWHLYVNDDGSTQWFRVNHDS